MSNEIKNITIEPRFTLTGKFVYRLTADKDFDSNDLIKAEYEAKQEALKLREQGFNIRLELL